MPAKDTRCVVGLLSAACLWACQSPAKPPPAAPVAADAQNAADAAACDFAQPACQLAQAKAALAADQRTIARFVAHLHGPYSKDACDGHGLTGDVPDAPCLADLRAGICASGLDVVFLTDHPSHMKDYPFPALLYHAATDTLVSDGNGQPVANVLHCAATAGAKARDVTLLVGYEGDHTMPLGLQAHLQPKDLYNRVLDDALTPLADAQAVVDAVHQRGGLMTLVHAEQKAVSPERVRDLQLDAVEIYNIHANFILGFMLAPNRLFEFEPFLAPLPKGADANLAVLVALQYLPDEGLHQWQLALRYRRVGAIVGSDCHENVELPELCGLNTLLDDECQKRAQTAPAAVAALGKGGQIVLNDGHRFDWYQRMLRWYSSRARLPAQSKLPVHAQVQAAVAAGATYQVWNVFGEPDAVQLVASAGAGFAAGQGEALAAEAPKTGRILAFRLPQPLADPWSPFADAAAKNAPRVAKLWRVTPDGPQVAATWDANGHAGLQVDGDVAWLADPPPGRYHLELRIVPAHLAPYLPGAASLAARDYRWVVSGVVELN